MGVHAAAPRGPSLLLVVVSALLLRLGLFLLPQFEVVWQTLERRPELSTPVSSFIAVKEAVYLRSLYRASPASLPKPYANQSLYLPPILLAVLDPLFSQTSTQNTHLFVSMFWSLADILSSLLIADIFERKSRYIKRTHREASAKSSSRSTTSEIDLNLGSLTGSKGLVAAIYLFNPFTLASCLARSTTSLTSLMVLAAVDASMAASPLLLALALSSAILSSLYPVLLLPSLILLCSRQAVPSSRSLRRRAKLFSTSAAVLSFILFGLSLTGGIYGSYIAAEKDWTFVNRAYGTILTLPDLSPNIGLWWYFFIEIFDHFRDFFLLAFNVHVASYSIPLTIRYRQDPLFAVTILCGFIATLKSYPSLGDTALFLSLLSLHSEIQPYLRHPLVTCLLFIVATILMSAMHHLWLVAGSGNANFFYATTLVWALASGAATLDAMWAWGRWRWELERPHDDQPDGVFNKDIRRKVVQM